MRTEPLPLESWLEESGALLSGHFELSSGLHSLAYVQCARLLELPERARRVGEELAELVRPQEPDSILAPALGGIIIGHEVASALGLPFRFVERVADEMSLRRGFCLRRAERIAVIEDVVTTGQSTLEAMREVERLQASVCGAAAILDRTDGGSPFTVPFASLMQLRLPTFRADECPSCRQGRPLSKPGSRAILDPPKHRCYDR